MRTLLLAAVLLASACKSDSSKCSFSVGNCAPGAEQCGVHAACDKNQYQLSCTPPAVDSKQIDCKCVENGVIGKTVQIAYPMQGEATAVMKSACGWSL